MKIETQPLKWYLEDEIALGKDILWEQKQEKYNEEAEKNTVIGKKKTKVQMKQMANVKMPRWYQDFSIDQMTNLSMLEGVITKDYEELVTGRTQRMLMSIGIVSTFFKISPKVIRKMQESCDNNVIEFLREIYKLLTGSYFEEEGYKKFYDCNERIILSALAFLTLPEAILELHKRLPPVIMPKLPLKPSPPTCPPRRKMSSPYEEELFTRPDWATYRNKLQHWEERCKLIPKPKVILPSAESVITNYRRNGSSDNYNEEKDNKLESHTQSARSQHPKGNTLTNAQHSEENTLTHSQHPKGNTLTHSQHPKENTLTHSQYPKENTLTHSQYPKENTVTHAQHQKGNISTKAERNINEKKSNKLQNYSQSTKKENVSAKTQQQIEVLDTVKSKKNNREQNTATNMEKVESEAQEAQTLDDFDIPQLPDKNKTFDFTLNGLSEKPGPVEYKICGILNPPKPNEKSWLGEKHAHYVISGASDNPPTCPVSYEMTGIANVTPSNSNEKFFAVLKLGDGPNKIYPSGRKNLSKNWQEWLQKADEEYKKVESDANKLIKSIEATMRLVFPGPTCDSCCSCRQTRKSHIKARQTKTPYLVIDTVAEDKNKNKYIVGSMAMHSPAPSPQESTVNLLEVIASEDKVTTNLVINGVTNEKGQTQYFISGTKKETIHVPSRIVEPPPPLPLRNVPPCVCAVQKIFNKGLSPTLSDDNIPWTKEDGRCFGKKYRPDESGAYSCRTYPGDKSCRRNPFKREIVKLKRKMERAKLKEEKDQSPSAKKMMYSIADFQPCGDEHGMAVCSGPWGALNLLTPEELAEQERQRKEILRGPPCGTKPGRAVCEGPFGTRIPLHKPKVKMEEEIMGEGGEDEEEDEEEEEEEEEKEEAPVQVVKEKEKYRGKECYMSPESIADRKKVAPKKVGKFIPDPNYHGYDDLWNIFRTAPTEKETETEYEKSLQLSSPEARSLPAESKRDSKKAEEKHQPTEEVTKIERRVSKKEGHPASHAAKSSPGSAREDPKKTAPSSGVGTAKSSPSVQLKPSGVDKKVEEKVSQPAKEQIKQPAKEEIKQPAKEQVKQQAKEEVKQQAKEEVKQQAKDQKIERDAKPKAKKDEEPAPKESGKNRLSFISSKKKPANQSRFTANHKKTAPLNVGAENKMKTKNFGEPGTGKEEKEDRRQQVNPKRKLLTNIPASKTTEAGKKKSSKHDKKKDLDHEVDPALRRKKEIDRLKSMMMSSENYPPDVEPAVVPEDPPGRCKLDFEDKDEANVSRQADDDLDVQLPSKGPCGWRTKSEQELPTKKTLVYLTEPDLPIETIPVRPGGKACICRENRGKKKILLYNIGGLLDKKKPDSKEAAKLFRKKKEEEEKRMQVIDGVIYYTPPPSPRRSDEYVPEYDLYESPYDMCLRERKDDKMKQLEQHVGPRSLVSKALKSIEPCGCNNYMDTYGIINPDELGARKELDKAREELLESKSPKERWSLALKDVGLVDYFARCRDSLPCWLKCAKFDKEGCPLTYRKLKLKKPVCECKYERKILERTEEKTKWKERQKKLKSLGKQPVMNVVDTSRPIEPDTKLMISDVKRIPRDDEYVDDIKYCITGVAENYTMAPPQQVVAGMNMATPFQTPEESKQDIPCVCLHRHWSPIEIPPGPLPRKDAALIEEKKRRQEALEEAYRQIYAPEKVYDTHSHSCKESCNRKIEDEEESLSVEEEETVEMPQFGETKTLNGKRKDNRVEEKSGGRLKSTNVQSKLTKESEKGRKEELATKNRVPQKEPETAVKNIYKRNKDKPNVRKESAPVDQQDFTKDEYQRTEYETRSQRAADIKSSAKDETRSQRVADVKSSAKDVTPSDDDDLSFQDDKADLITIVKVELKKMALEGFLFAKLPKCYLMPQLQYWLMYRKGVVFTETDKNNLMRNTIAIWNMMSCAKSPKIETEPLGLSKKQMNSLTFDDAQEMKSKIEKKKAIFHSQVRKARVMNARSMWNSMEYGKFPSTSFKQAYFTYMPSKEADGHVYKPWSPSEM